MNKQRFSETVCKLLREAGWDGMTRRDSQIFAAMVKQAGLDMPPAVSQFIDEFNCVDIEYLAADGELRSVYLGETGVKQHDFSYRSNPDSIKRLRDLDVVAGPLIPIGSDEFTWMTLFMNPVGQVFGAFPDDWPSDDRVLLLGLNGDDAIETIVESCPVEKVSLVMCTYKDGIPKEISYVPYKMVHDRIAE